MSLTKINWLKIKQEYLISEIEEVREFLRVVFGQLSVTERTIDNRTKGWPECKRQFKAKLTAKIQEKLINSVDIQKEQEKLLIGKRNIINSILARIQTNNKELTMQELSIALKSIKVELGETLDISTVTNNIITPITEVIIKTTPN